MTLIQYVERYQLAILSVGRTNAYSYDFGEISLGKEARNVKLKWQWLPAWDMPADPVKAVFWFFHWFLQVLVRYFFIPILAGVVYETYLNGIVGLFGTLFVGLLVWAGLVVLLWVVRVSAGVSRVYAEVQRLQENPAGFADFLRPQPEKEKNVVEGSLITDLDEERRKRRQEI